MLQQTNYMATKVPVRDQQPDEEKVDSNAELQRAMTTIKAYVKNKDAETKAKSKNRNSLV